MPGSGKAAPRNRSGFFIMQVSSGAVMQAQCEEELEQDIIEGRHEMADVYLEIQREFAPLAAEITRSFYPG